MISLQRAQPGSEMCHGHQEAFSPAFSKQQYNARDSTDYTDV